MKMMMHTTELTKGRVNREIVFGYDGVANARRTSPSQLFETWIPHVAKVTDVRTASINAARICRASTDKEIVVLYSGGLDSEWVLESFRLANIPVTALVVVYSDGLNQHDVLWAQAYLKRNPQVKVIYEELDLRAWYKDPHQKQVAEWAQTPELAYTAQFQTLEKLNTSDRFFITSYDEPYLVAEDATGVREWNLTYSERHYSVIKFFDALGIDGMPNWSKSTKELFAAYTYQPQWQAIAAGLYQPQVWNSELVKVPMFKTHFPAMAARTKYTGFEYANEFIVDATRLWKQDIMERFGATWCTDWTMPIRNVWEQLGVVNG